MSPNNAFTFVTNLKIGKPSTIATFLGLGYEPSTLTT